MADFVQLWVYLASTPLFGLTATLAVYVAAQALYERLGRAPWANPVLWSVVAIACVLLATRTPYPTYFAGAQFVHVLLGPAVVALAWPLWLRRREIRGRGVAIGVAALVGGLVAGGSAVGLGWLVGLPDDVLRSLAPKSVTAPVAMGIAERIGGVPALAAVFAVLTGIVGALSAKYLFDAMRIVSWPVRGFALGTASHGIGAARAIQVDADAGAYAGMALGLQVMLAALLMPLFSLFF
jgi:predicted murein hydrolase (TIGR00659 family)